jgi:hypothetical protein
MGMAAWENDEIRDATVQCPFENVDAVLDLDPVKVYGICDIDRQAEEYRQWYARFRADYPEAVCPGGIYRSMVSFCIEAFGWDLFLEALATDENRFKKVMEGIAEVILSHVKAWAKVDIDCFITHDDIAWSAGPFTRPDWYRENVFPYYREYWNVLHQAGKKVLYCSDGDVNLFIDDAAECGADGFVFEPSVDLKSVCEKYGQTHVIIGNADSRIAASGPARKIRDEIDRCLSAGRSCPGYFFAWGNHLPANIPVENVEFTFEYFEANRSRRQEGFI